MAQVHTHINPFEQRVYDYCFQRRCELEKVISDARKELEFFVDLQSRQDRCPNCSGKGYWRMYDNNDEISYMEPCNRCGGTGGRTL